MREALQYIRNMVITEKVVKHSDRAEADRFFNFPYAAIEEALSNAVYHRAYDEREPIEVRVENDRIGDFLKELHLTEGRNTGFKKILDALEANGSPKPEFETDEDRSYFITRLFVHEGFYDVSNGELKMSEPLKHERSLSEVLRKKDFSKVEKIISVLEEKGEITPLEFTQ